MKFTGMIEMAKQAVGNEKKVVEAIDKQIKAKTEALEKKKAAHVKKITDLESEINEMAAIK